MSSSSLACCMPTKPASRPHTVVNSHSSHIHFLHQRLRTSATLHKIFAVRYSKSQLDIIAALWLYVIDHFRPHLPNTRSVISKSSTCRSQKVQRRSSSNRDQLSVATSNTTTHSPGLGTIRPSHRTPPSCHLSSLSNKQFPSDSVSHFDHIQLFLGQTVAMRRPRQ